MTEETNAIFLTPFEVGYLLALVTKESEKRKKLKSASTFEKARLLAEWSVETETNQSHPAARSVFKKLLKCWNATKKECEAATVDLGNDMVQITDKSGSVIIRGKYPWERKDWDEEEFFGFLGGGK